MGILTPSVHTHAVPVILPQINMIRHFWQTYASSPKHQRLYIFIREDILSVAQKYSIVYGECLPKYNTVWVEEDLIAHTNCQAL